MFYAEIEKYSPDLYYYNLKDKAYNHVMMRVLKNFEEASEIRRNIKTLDDLHIWQENARKVFRESVGKIPYDRTYPLNAQITGRITEVGLTIEKIIFEARENVYVTANLYIPAVREAKCPAVLFQCGHSFNGKASELYQRAARIIADAGIMVLVTDPPGQGERSNYMEGGKQQPLVACACPDHQQFGNQCFLTGASPVKYFLADAMRAIDYLCSRSDVDPDRIGATGISGGGTLTAALMVIDERIKAAAPGCWPTSGWEYFLIGSSPDAEQVWPDTLKNHFEHYETMASMCPKPLLLLAQEDDFVPIEGTEKLFEECKRLWTLSGNGDKIHIHIAAGPHGFSESNAQAAAEFFRNYLCAKGNKSNVSIVKDLSEEELICTRSGQVAVDYKNNLTVYDENLKEYEEYLSICLPIEERRRILREKVDFARKPVSRFRIRHCNKVQESGFCAEMLMWFTQELMPCYGVLCKDDQDQTSKISVTICLWQGGTDSLVCHLEKIEQIRKAGRSVLVVDLSAMGKCTPNKPLAAYDPCQNISSVTDKISKTLMMLGDSLCAMRAFDLMQTIKMLREEFGINDLEVYAEGKYAIYARIVEILDEKVYISLSNEVMVSDLITEKYYDHYDIAQVVMLGLGTYVL